MRQALHILVAIHAGKHGAMNGMLELAFIHKQADLFALHVRGQCGVGVTGKTVSILELMFGMSRTSPDKQGQNERLSENSFARVHAYEEMLCWKSPQ
jgi:hypothetical protein